MKKNLSFSEVASTISSLQRFVVLSHYNPDADAYGSSCGLSLALAAQGKQVCNINETGILQRYSYVPGLHLVGNEFPEKAPDGKAFDALVICDCGDIARVGERFRPKIGTFPIVINVDHHISNDLFGTHNLVLPDASSTSELIFEVLAAMGRPISAEVATALFVGISGDTGSYRYTSTSARTFQVAAELVRQGANPGKIGQDMYGANSLASIRLQTEAMSNMRMLYGDRISEIISTDEMYRKYGAQPEDADTLVEKGRDITGVCISVLVKQERDIWRISLRSVDARFNVSEIATMFGGGGHKVAAGFRWRRSLEELRAALYPELEKILSRSSQ